MGCPQGIKKEGLCVSVEKVPKGMGLEVDISLEFDNSGS